MFYKLVYNTREEQCNAQTCQPLGVFGVMTHKTADPSLAIDGMGGVKMHEIYR